jgi:hypothetical protein
VRRRFGYRRLTFRFATKVLCPSGLAIKPGRVSWHYIAANERLRRKLHGRLRDELLNETLFTSLMHWKIGGAIITMCGLIPGSAGLHQRSMPLILIAARTKALRWRLHALAPVQMATARLSVQLDNNWG